MERLACVSLPAFPLQLLLRRHPAWASCPAVVVDEDKPQGSILWVNDKARQVGVLPGLRYASALSIAAGLRAAEVSPVEIARAVADLNHRLMGFTPEVEPAAQEPGIFWLNGRGLKRLYASPRKWARAILSDIEAQGFQADLSVGFTRFGTYAAAKAARDMTIFRDLSEERQTVQKIPLDCLDLEADFRDTLLKLGINTVGALLSLPPAGLYERFGSKAYRLYRMAAGDLWTPLEPFLPQDPVRQRCILDDPENDTTRLLFLIKQLLHPMMTTLGARSQALAALWLSFMLDRDGELKEQIRPAKPTLDSAQILDLVRLRLESVRFAAGVIEIELTAEECAATREQLRLFAEKPTRDLDAANRALARLRAEFGDKAVVQAKLTDGHLPEARFAWEPLGRLKFPEPKKAVTKTLVRRVLTKPRPLSSSPHQSHEGGGWLLLGPKYGTIDKLTGPYVFSGGWWNREIQRDYYFAETRRGDIVWVYYDRVRRRWFLQGWVE
jgi:protein ImuB